MSHACIVIHLVSLVHTRTHIILYTHTHTHTHTLRIVEHGHRNNMKAADLAIVFGSTIMHAEHVSLEIVTLMPVQNGIVELFINE